MINNFDYCENLGRDKFKQVCDGCGLQVNFTKDKFNNLDAYFYCKDENGFYWRGAVEIKNRFSNYDTWKIEDTKYLALENEINSGNSRWGYFAMFYENELWMYDFNTVKNWRDNNGTTTMYARKTTCGNSGYVQKKVLDLPKDIAMYWKKFGNNWARC